MMRSRVYFNRMTALGSGDSDESHSPSSRQTGIKIWPLFIKFLLATLVLHHPFCCPFRKQDAGQGERAAGVWQQLAEGQVGEESAERGGPVQAGGRVEGEKRPKAVRARRSRSLPQQSHHFLAHLSQLCLPIELVTLTKVDTAVNDPDGGAAAQPSVGDRPCKIQQCVMCVC